VVDEVVGWALVGDGVGFGAAGVAVVVGVVVNGAGCDDDCGFVFVVVQIGSKKQSIGVRLRRENTILVPMWRCLVKKMKLKKLSFEGWWSDEGCDLD
jgi:hypothetical protein